VVEELIKLLDDQLKYISHEIDGATIIVRVESARNSAVCPYCATESEKVHSRYERSIYDLPICGKKTRIVIHRRKFFCMNAECSKKTYAEDFKFMQPRATKTGRLQDEILKVSLTQSSVSAAKYLRNSVTEVSKSTVCNMLRDREKKS